LHFAITPASYRRFSLSYFADRRLERVRDWIDEDQELARLIDSVIGRQAKRAERRQHRMNLVYTRIFLVAGWFLSLVSTPTTLATLLHR
jgi:hypothetical protein